MIVVPLEIQHGNRVLETKDDCLDSELLLPFTCACSRGGSFSLFVNGGRATVLTKTHIQLV